MIKHLNISDYSDLLKGYTELRFQENRNMRIGFFMGNNVNNSRTSNSGVSARVYKQGCWGFASSPELDRNAVELVLKSAAENAAFLNANKVKTGRGLPISVPVTKSSDFSTKKPARSQKDLIDYLKEADAYIAEKYPKLASRYVGLNCLDMEKNLVTNENTISYSNTTRSLISVLMSTEKDGSPVELYNLKGGLGQFEDHFNDPSELHDMIDRLYEDLMKKRDGIYADAGLKTCILAADIAGILAHEAIGHTTEADLVMAGSVAGDYINREVASHLVSLVDFAHTYRGEVCPVPVYVDDEGIEANDAVLIEDGILKGFMHNRESAHRFGTAPTGNARAYEFFDEPLIRMRNTAILPGTSKLEEMIASVDDGYYLVRTNNGQADTTSEFTFGITMGYEIKNGRLGRALKDTTISGIAFDMLKTITAVSDDMTWSCAGMCGKKQIIPVGMGGPAIKCKVNIGGR